MTIASKWIIKVLLPLAALLNVQYITSCKQASSAETVSTPSHDTVRPKASKSPTPVITSDKKNTSTRCPVCKKKKLVDEEICGDCHDEVANTCYRCNRYEYQVNGKLCSKCSKTICALCNRRKDFKDDDLCSRCHNAIEVKKKK